MTSAELRRIVEARSWPKTWFARGQHLSRRPDNTGMGGSLHTNHIGVMADRDDATAVATLANHADALVALVEAVERWARGLPEDGATLEVDDQLAAALAAVHAVRSTP